MERSDRVYVLVHNIPKNIRSKHLRNFFSEAIEKGLLRCFHYRHRKCSTLDSLRIELNKDTYACFVKLRNCKALKRFQTLYDNKPWVDGKNSCCQVHLLFIDESSLKKYNKNEESVVERINIDNINSVQMKQILEMRPPKILPRGNVGTPIRYIMKSIRKCEMPASILVKLGISLQDICYRRKYVCISWDYNKRNRFFSNRKHPERHETSTFYNNNSKPVEDDDDELEEWDRHEASCEDPFKMVPKERLYEQNMDVVWEKGGPGLVWYTDAVFWDATEENDEKDTDDWDVDHEEIDKELNLQLLNPDVPQQNYSFQPNNKKLSKADSSGSKQLRSKIDKKTNFQLIKSNVSEEHSLLQKKKKLSKADLNGFKELTDGFGGKIIKKFGWRKGDGLGARNQGLTEAIPNDGQSSNDKSGFGYRGNKLFNFGLTDEKN